MLATHCPICGAKKNILKVGAYPVNEQEVEPYPGTKPYGLAIITDNGEACCYFDEGQFATRQEADASAAEFDADVLATMADDLRDNAILDYDHDDGYGPVDSDPYDVDYPCW